MVDPLYAKCYLFQSGRRAVGLTLSSRLHIGGEHVAAQLSGMLKAMGLEYALAQQWVLQSVGAWVPLLVTPSALM